MAIKRKSQVVTAVISAGIALWFAHLDNQVGLIIAVLVCLLRNNQRVERGMSLFWGIVWLASVLTPCGVVCAAAIEVSFPDRVIRILEHVGPAVMAALVVTTLSGSEGQLEAAPSSSLHLL